jgi:RNA polymerase sigma factor FliA
LVASLPSRQDGKESSPSREQLIESHLPLVTFVVSRMAASFLAGIMEREDAIGYGIKGLIQAVDNYDPARGVAFGTYATVRIRGAIIDAAREQDILPRSLRGKIRQVESANLELANALGRWPTVTEVAARTGLAVSEVHSLLNQRGARVVSLEQSMTNPDSSFEWEAEDDDDSVDPAAVTDRKATLELLTDAMSTMAPRDRQIIHMRYGEGMSFSAIGKELAISESRVCQIHVRIIGSLRKQFAGMGLAEAA